MKRPKALFWICFIIWLASDLLTKAWATEALKGNPPLLIIPGFFQLIYHTNVGVAFGMFSHSPYNKILPFFILGIFVWMVWYSRQLSWEKKGVNAGAALVTAGAIGNMIDRWKQGFVVDFLDFTFWGWSYPTFNVADTGVCVGLGLVLLCEWKKYEQTAKRNSRSETAEKRRHLGS